MVEYIVDQHTTIPYNNNNVVVPNILIALLGIMKSNNDDKWDSLILITGDVGTAKSSLGIMIAGIWEQLYKRELSIDNFTWNAKGVVDFIDREDNETQAIIYDEAIKGGTGRDVITKEGNLLKIGLVVGRRKRHLYVMIVDELAEFNKKIISRASLLINMRTKLVNGKRARGYFNVYNKNELRDIYWLLKDKKIKYIQNFKTQHKPLYKFKDPTGIFIDENEYEAKKIEQTKQEVEDGKINWTKDKVTAFGLRAQGKTYADIARLLKLNASTVSNWGSEFKIYLLS